MYLCKEGVLLKLEEEITKAAVFSQIESKEENQKHSDNS